MKGLQIAASVGSCLLVGLGTVMALTNPGQDAYEEYAVVQLGDYLKNNVCKQADVPQAFEGWGDFVENQCLSLVDVARPQIGKFVGSQTDRQNFVFFSTYTTELSLGGPFPSYRFETVAALGAFYTYESQKE